MLKTATFNKLQRRLTTDEQLEKLKTVKTDMNGLQEFIEEVALDCSPTVANELHDFFKIINRVQIDIG
jgi:hypothetical protein